MGGAAWEWSWAGAGCMTHRWLKTTMSGGSVLCSVEVAVECTGCKLCSKLKIPCTLSFKAPPGPPPSSPPSGKAGEGDGRVEPDCDEEVNGSTAKAVPKIHGGAIERLLKIVGNL